MTEDELDLLVQRLSETIAWCNAEADLKDPKCSLRTESLKPTNYTINSDGYPDYTPCDFESWKDSVTSVSTRRSTQLLNRYILGGSLNSPSEQGLPAVYLPDETLNDGLSEEESNGFFDVNDFPPWDT